MTKKKNTEENYRCQFCGKESPSRQWKKDRCPLCKKEYNIQLAQDSEE